MATESVCPKGWTLPANKQIDANRDTANFSPIYGGNYINSNYYNKTSDGYWWGSETTYDTTRYDLHYTGGALRTDNYYRNGGYYIRCVSEEKTVTDLTYMQDMTPSIANWTPSL